MLHVFFNHIKDIVEIIEGEENWKIYIQIFKNKNFIKILCNARDNLYSH